MNREEFFKYVEQNIKSHLPMEYQDADIRLVSVTKTNLGEVHGINLSWKGENVAPTFYLDNLYESFDRDGEDIFPIMEHVADMIVRERDRVMPMDVKSTVHSLENYEFAKQNLAMKICDFESNQEYLQDHVYTRKNDFAVTYHVKVAEMEDGTFTAPVTTRMLENWGKTAEELHQDALQAQIPENKPTLRMVEEIVMKTMGMRSEEPRNYLQEDKLPELGESGIQLLVLTNENTLNGAAMMMHQDVLDKIGELLGQDYYVLPSSLHEVLIMIAEEKDVRTLQEMVHEINETQVDTADLLSDKVQFYDTTTHVLENAIERMERMETLQKEQEKQAEAKAPSYPKKTTPELSPSF